MNAQHTPGPWNYRINMVDSKDHQNGTHAGYYVEARETGDGHYWRVADVFGQKDKDAPLATRHGYDEANARLIAAAPELLEALQELISDHDYLRRRTKKAAAGPCPIQAQARAAIAKAIGEVEP